MPDRNQPQLFSRGRSAYYCGCAVTAGWDVTADWVYAAVVVLSAQLWLPRAPFSSLVSVTNVI